MIAVSMQAKTNAIHQNAVTFDTDSQEIGVDNRCTGCISHVAEDFIGPLQDCNRSIKGFGGTRTTNIKIDTLRWQWQDDQGQVHTFLIPNSFYVPSGSVRLLSPQHWAQGQKDRKPIQGTGTTTDAMNITLFWKQRKHKLTIPLDKASNVATFHLAPGYNKFEAFCAEAGLDPKQEDTKPIIAEEARIVSDDEDDPMDMNDPDQEAPM